MPGVDAGIQMYGGLLIDKGYQPHQHLVNNKPTLIYIIAAGGFFIKSNPFLGVRIIELVIFLFDLFLIHGIVKTARLKQPVLYLLSFCGIYLVSWDEGFLPEVFTIPLVLLAVYLLLRKARYYELAVTLCMVLSFMLKQNAFAVIGGVILVDILSKYRAPNAIKKSILHVTATAAWLLLAYMIIDAYGAWTDFIYQAIIYNGKYADRLPFMNAVINHIRHNSFVSVKGISMVMLLNAAMVFTLWKFYKRYQQKIALSFEDRFLLCAILIYIPAYFFTYISGKSHPHYYMLLIVPATFVLGRYVTDSAVAKVALGLLLVYGVYQNFGALDFNRQQSKSKTAIAAYLKQNTSADERIHIVGMGNQYIYVMAGRLSHTKFIIPIVENHGYRDIDKQMLDRDFAERLPKYMVTNKNYKPIPGNYYFEKIEQALKNYTPVFRDDRYIVYALNGATHR